MRKTHSYPKNRKRAILLHKRKPPTKRPLPPELASTGELMPLPETPTPATFAVPAPQERRLPTDEIIRRRWTPPKWWNKLEDIP